MRLTRLAALGLASFALAGAATAAEPGRHHVVNLALPDGAIARIHYVGDTPPAILVDPGPEFGAWPAAFDAAWEPFAMLDRIAFDMDRQMAAMLRQADLAFAAGTPAGLDLAAASSLPEGAVSYSFVSTSDGRGTCSRSVRMISLGQGKAPKVESQLSGDCARAAGAPAAPAAAAPAPRQAVAPAPAEAPRPLTRT